MDCGEGISITLAQRGYRQCSLCDWWVAGRCVKPFDNGTGASPWRCLWCEAAEAEAEGDDDEGDDA